MRSTAAAVCLGALVATACGDTTDEKGCRRDSDCATGQACSGYRPGAGAEASLPTGDGGATAGGETLGTCVSSGTQSDGGTGQGYCKGNSKWCTSFYSQWECGGQGGCYWSFATDSCTGNVKGCYTYDDNKKACYQQSGCYWEPR